jgi:hypothetical protein
MIYYAAMVVSNSPHRLRESALRYRLLASEGRDLRENAALLQLAEEFDQEATKLECHFSIVFRTRGPAEDDLLPPAQSRSGKSA